MTLYFVDKFTSALVEKVMQCGLAGKLRGMHIGTYLIEQRLWRVGIGGTCATQQSLGLGQDDVGKAEDRNVGAYEFKEEKTEEPNPQE